VAFTHIDGDEVNFCVTVLARLGGGHINNFAGPALDHHVPADVRNFVRKTEAKSQLETDQGYSPVLPESRALHRIGERGPRTGLLERVIVLLIVLVVGHAEWRVFSTTTAGLLSAEESSSALAVAVDKDRAGSNELTEVGGDGRNQVCVANPEFVMGAGPHKRLPMITSASGPPKLMTVLHHCWSWGSTLPYPRSCSRYNSSEV